MNRFWNSKIRKFFRQSTALAIVGALLFTAIAPPFAASKGIEAHTLRKELLSMNLDAAKAEVQRIAKEIAPPNESFSTYERGIQFFQKLTHRTDTPDWMVALTKIIYAPLSAETWELQAFRINEFIEAHNPRSSVELQQIKNNITVLFSGMWASFIYLNHYFSLKFFDIYFPHTFPEIAVIILAASVISALISLFPIQITIHMGINIFRVITHGAALTKKKTDIPHLDGTTEIAGSVNGLRAVFVGANNLPRELKSKLGEVPEEQKTVTVDGIEFFTRRKVQSIVWSFKKEDIDKVAKLMNWQTREEGQKGRLTHREVVHRDFKDLESLFSPELFVDLSIRYSLDIRNILWGLVSSKLQGKYNEEEIKRLIDEKIVELIHQETDIDVVSDDEVSIVRPTRPTVEIGSSHVLDPLDLTQVDISNIAGKLEQKFNSIEEEKALQALKAYSIHFIKKLEERYFFKTYYTAHPDQFTGEKAKENLQEILKEEKIGMVKEVLEELLAEIEEAISLQDQLHKVGLRNKTYLNLYQLIGVKRMGEDKKVTLADEMGLGKTLETISTFLLSDAEEMLVIAPAAALSRWMEDLKNHTDTEIEFVLLSPDSPLEGLEENEKIHINWISKPEERKQYLYGKRAPPKGNRKRIILTSYGTYINTVEKDKPIHIDFLACDEAHLLKNRTTKTSRSIFGGETKNKEKEKEYTAYNAIEADYKVLITGTPLENKPSDLFGLLQYLAQGGISEIEKFLQSVTKGRFAQIFHPSNISKLADLHGYLSSRMIRRLKDDVMTGLPEKVYTQVKLDPIRGLMRMIGNGKNGVTEEEVKLSQDYTDQAVLYGFALQDPKGFEETFVKNSPNKTLDDDDEEDVDILGGRNNKNQILRLEQVALDPSVFGQDANSIKFDAVKLLLDERVKKNNKSVVIFTNYRTVSSHLKEYLLTQGYSPEEIAYVDGKVTRKDKQREIQRFQNKEARIMIATLGTMELAVELTQADSMIFLNYPWKPSSLNQAIDRSHRYDPKRNYPGKKLEILALEIDLPISIDALKARVLKRKAILAEMLVEGHLSREVLSAFYQADLSILDTLEEAAQDPVKLDPHEMTLLQEFRLKLGVILQTRDQEILRELWDEVSELYYQILEHKGSFFANMASLDYLSGNMFPEFKGKELKALDLASGPSTLYRAYTRKQMELGSRNFKISKVVDYDLSEKMLRRGVSRPGDQVVGSFRDVGETFKENSFDIVNLSYAFRYADHPAKLIQDIHKVLKENGLFVLILPESYTVPNRFYEALKEAGFDLKVFEGGVLESKLDDHTYVQLVKEYGKEFATDIARKVRGRYTYLVANKIGEQTKELKDEDFMVVRKEIISVKGKKVKALNDPLAKYKIVPEDGQVEGEVIYDSAKGEIAASFNKELRRIRKLMSDISMLSEKYTGLSIKNKKLEEEKERVSKEMEKSCSKLIRMVHNNISSFNFDEKRAINSDLNHLKNRKKLRNWLDLHEEVLEELDQLEITIEESIGIENGNGHNGNGQNGILKTFSHWIAPLAAGIGLLLLASPVWAMDGSVRSEFAPIVLQALVSIILPMTVVIGALNRNQLNNKINQKSINLKEELSIRTVLKEHPINNLFYAFTYNAIKKNSSQGEEDLILIHLDQFDHFESEGSLYFAMQGILNYISLNEDRKIKIMFVKDSEDLGAVVETLTLNYPKLKELLLPSVRTPDEAIRKSKGYKIAYVITRVPKMWKGLVKDLVILLSGGTELILQGTIAREVMGMMNSMGFVGAEGNYWNYIRGKLTIKVRNLKPDDLKKLKEPEFFKSQA